MNHTHEAAYWDSISSAFRSAGAQRLWRAHSDQVYRALLELWLNAGAGGRFLKTDLFDEAVAEGLVPFLRTYSDAVSGIDLAGEVVQAALTRYPDADFRQADVRELPHKDQSFDLILSNSTLDHFKSSTDIERALRELYRVLRRGGKLVVSFDNLQNPIVRLRNSLPYGLLNSAGLVPYFVGETVDRKRLGILLDSMGFRVIETRCILHCPRVIAVPLAGWFQRRASLAVQKTVLRWLMKFERFQRSPISYFTGHYVCALAIRQ
jgi:SAM-dependent methyltransferase